MQELAQLLRAEAIVHVVVVKQICRAELVDPFARQSSPFETEDALVDGVPETLVDGGLRLYAALVVSLL
jgi:hypothetical protein